MPDVEYEKWIAELRLEIHQLKLRNESLARDNFNRQMERVELLGRIADLEKQVKTTGDAT